MKSRRKFLKNVGGLVAASSLSSFQSKNVQIIPTPKWPKTDRNYKIGLIGSGIIGQIDTDTALRVPGIELVAVCDLYTGRLTRAKEKWGSHIFTTKDYREVLARAEIDAVLICTSDNWHQKIAMDALNAGKHVYCEKPMVQYIEQGQGIIDAQKKSGKVFQVGSQRASSVAILKAREFYRQGVIGDITNVQTTCFRTSANGAWVYAIPTDASLETVDYDTFLADAPKVPFDPKRFFRWRNYKDYGTGVAGDLIVHLLTSVHVVTDSIGPNKIFALGDLNYWKDGRDAYDLVTSIMEYPKTAQHQAFQLLTQINLAHGKNESSYACKIYGTEGAIEIGWNDFKVSTLKRPQSPGLGSYGSFNTFSAAQQKDYEKWYKSTYGDENSRVLSNELIDFQPEDGYDDRLDHFHIFFNAIDKNDPGLIIEDATFGLRAAAPSIACNLSTEQQKPIFWDAEKLKVN